MITGTILLAITALLTPMRPSPDKPVAWEAELTEDEALAFDEGNEWVSELYERKRLWNNFLALMNCKESPQSTAGVRFTLTYKDRVWAFDAYGHFWNDSRFVREDETEGLEILESWFKELVERSPYAGFRWMAEEGETVYFRGFDDGRFNVMDFQLMRICEEFNHSPELFLDGDIPSKLAKSVHELHPRLLKSLLLEEGYWDYPGDLNDEKIAQTIAELVKCGFNEGGRFEGWFNAIRDYGARHGWRGYDEYYHSQYAERVTKRFNNPGQFVPVVGRKAIDE